MIEHSCEQRSTAWFDLRMGVPTTSEFGCLVTPTGKPSTQYKDYAYRLANELFLGGGDPDEFEGNLRTLRGAEVEEQAVQWYEFITGQKVKPVGFVTDDAKTVGCSPDGMIGEQGLLEIKCLKAVNHTAARVGFSQTGEPPMKYKPQCQGQMMVTGRKWVDLLFYHPRLDPFFVRVEPDKEYVAMLREQLAAVQKLRDHALEIMRGKKAALKSQQEAPQCQD